jgi:redox-sensitive bicupin YhaK (pirin superfamily)
MIQITKEMQHYKGEHDWLTTYHHFSFAEYYDPNNTNFGPLRVFNDDTMKPGTGFDFHRHQDMEIVTYVIDGTLEHKDSLGNHGIIQPGEIQRMSAGTGVLHSEFNILAKSHCDSCKCGCLVIPKDYNHHGNKRDTQKMTRKTNYCL